MFSFARGLAVSNMLEPFFNDCNFNQEIEEHKDQTKCIVWSSLQEEFNQGMRGERQDISPLWLFCCKIHINGPNRKESRQ